jgi:hypothetical protein
MYWDVSKSLEDVLRYIAGLGCIGYIGCIDNWHDVLKCIEGCIGCIVIMAGCIE